MVWVIIHIADGESSWLQGNRCWDRPAKKNDQESQRKRDLELL